MVRGQSGPPRIGADEFKALTTLGPAIIRVGLRNSDDVGARLDLKAEVFLGEVMIGDGELDNVTGGNSGFGNAVLKSIALQLPAPVDASLGPSLSMRLSVRITCTGRGHASGTPRLWFNDAQADSRFSATIGGVRQDYFLLGGFGLGTATGPQELDGCVRGQQGGLSDAPVQAVRNVEGLRAVR